MTMPNILYNGPGNWPDADKLMANYDYLENIAKGYTSFRNRIINGDMRIDQRNAGASVTQTTGNIYPVDRWRTYGSVTSKFTAQRNYGITPPTGFSNHLGINSLSAYPVGAAEVFTITNTIEGSSISDFQWGTSSAKTVTLSFWFRSNMAGGTVFGGSLQNGGTTRSYPFTFASVTTSTWEYKTITIPGDQSGTWATDDTAGIVLRLSLGAGSTFSGPAGAWAAGDYRSATGAASIVGTNAATYYITGVQLEVGTIATQYELLPMATQLTLCQRYFEKSIPQTVAVGTSTNGLYMAGTVAGTSMAGHVSTVRYAVEKRAIPTLQTYDNAGTSAKISTWTGGSATNGVALSNPGWQAGSCGCLNYHNGTVAGIQYNWTAEAEI